MADQDQSPKTVGPLKVAEYDDAEAEAMATAPIRVIEAFQAAAFNQTGVPIRIRREDELYKYIEMHYMGFESIFSNILQGITSNEYELVQRVTTQLCDFSQSNFGKKAIARGGVLSALNVFRHIGYLFGDACPRVFEIGPGTGYLGAMLMLQGYPYTATDVSQAYYLYQNHIWNSVSDGQVRELAQEGNGDIRWTAPPAGGAIHVPWWQFARLTPDAVPSFDIVTCNHAIREMQPKSLGFSLRMAREFLKDNQAPKAFVFEGWGSGLINSDANVTARFYDLGFVLAHNDPFISVFVPKGSPWGKSGLELPRFNRSLRSQARDLARQIAGSSTRLRNAGFTPVHYGSPENPASRAITEGREATKTQTSVGIDEILKFYTEVLGQEDHSSPDERFLRIAHGS